MSELNFNQLRENSQNTLKICLMGRNNVGKHTLVKQNCTPLLDSDFFLTIGAEFFVYKFKIEKSLNLIKLNIFLLNGDKKFEFLTLSYLREAKGIVLIFDLSDYKSFQILSEWISRIKLSIKEAIPIILVGNKCDLVNNRQVSTRSILKFINTFNITYIESSFLTNKGIKEVFQMISYLALKIPIPDNVLNLNNIFYPDPKYKHRKEFQSINLEYFDILKLIINELSNLQKLDSIVYIKGEINKFQKQISNNLENLLRNFKANLAKSEKIDENQQILLEIVNGESEIVEFKSSYKWDVIKKRVNKNLPKEISKTVAAFSNSRGGTLYIGITDDSQIKGLNGDLKLFKNIDVLQQEISKTIRNKLGGAGINFHMTVEILNEKYICILRVKSSKIPVFFEEKEFYVRRGTSSHKLNPKETYEYIKSHF